MMLMLTQACFSQMRRNLKHSETPGQVLWASAKRRDPAPILQVRVDGTRTFVPNEMGDEVGRFVSPIGRLVRDGERYLESLER